MPAISLSTPQFSILETQHRETVTEGLFFEKPVAHHFTVMDEVTSAVGFLCCCCGSPECVQLPELPLQSSGQQVLSRVSHMIVTQVQLSQVGGIGVEGQSQRNTAFLRQQAAGQTGRRTTD